MFMINNYYFVYFNIQCCMSAPTYNNTDKVRPCSLRSGLSALGSGGRSFEEGSHLCFMYFKKEEKKKKNNLCSMSVIK